LAPPPVWALSTKIASDVIISNTKATDVARFADEVDKAKATLRKNDENAERLIEQLEQRLLERHPYALSQVIEICAAVVEEQGKLIRESAQANLVRTKREEKIATRIAALRRNVSLEEWQRLAVDERHALLTLSPSEVEASPFNNGERTDAELALWSWNPVVGCVHGCSYCSARDIAKSARMAKVYRYGFAPTFRPSTLLAPRSMRVPEAAARDTSFKNVFTCSMADLFGDWVPAEWIEAVLREIKNAPQWNFLCLTKFPKRMVEFDLPANFWAGTTVDLQSRVENAEDAFAKVKAGVRWLAVEPML
jgi:hypothetical protein